jgi:hypothetical protein
VLKTLLDFGPLVLWALLWIAGGCLLSVSLFRLRRDEAAMIGIGVGLVTETWLANVLAQMIPVVIAFWLAAVLTLLGGLTAVILMRRKNIKINFPFSLGPWLILLLLTILFVSIGRGLAIFEDYQNLPTISMMATGDIPPHFALDSQLSFNYHYLLLLFATQFMRLGSMYPWTALDASRGLIIALPLMLAWLWAYRLTRSHTASVLASIMLMFTGGARWLLLLLPQPILKSISDQVTLIGSASVTAPDLMRALLSNWKIEGNGPIPFPFAFHSGVFQSYVMNAYTGISGMAFIIVLLLLLTAQRWRNMFAGVIIFMLFSSLALANEVTFGLIVLGFALAVFVWMISRRLWKLPSGLTPWIVVLAAVGLAVMIQGGMFTEIVRVRLMSRPGSGNSYFDTTPNLVWPPAVISAHFGSLSLFNLSQLIVALTEIGPVILALPLVIVWGWKALRTQNWYEAALIGTSAWSLPALFVAFKGPLYTATPRLFDGLLFACTLYAVPLFWIWARKKSDAWRSTLIVAGLITIFAGLMLFGIQLISIQKPVTTTFISDLDVKVMDKYWNKLKPESLVLDPSPYQGPTVFGRATDSSVTWYVTKPEWQALLANPDPRQIHGQGYDYFYFGIDYWNRLTPQQQGVLLQPCVKKLFEVDGIHSLADYRKDFRRLLDVSACQ